MWIVGGFTPADAAEVRKEEARYAANAYLPEFYPGEWHLVQELPMYDLNGVVKAYIFIFPPAARQAESESSPTNFLACRQAERLAAGQTVSGYEPELLGEDRFAGIMISADDQEPPVLRCFKGLPPQLTRQVTVNQLAGQQAGSGRWQVRHALMLGFFDEAFVVDPEGKGESLVVDARSRVAVSESAAKARAAKVALVAADPEIVRLSQASWAGLKAQAVAASAGSTPQPADTVINENYINGATNSPSLVPTYLNNPTTYYPASAGGICWATCTADIFAYYDRNSYNGTQYWNLVRNGIAPLLQPSLPTAPGHNEADIKTVIYHLSEQYYGLGNYNEKAVIESWANQTSGLAFVATYLGPVTTSADRSNLYSTVRTEINAGRPIGVGSWGTYFGGAHQVPAIGYKQMATNINSTIYIHLNTGGTENQYANFYAASWGNLDMDKIVPGGVPVDPYEALGDNGSNTTVTLYPTNTYEFRQSHNFSVSGDVDWVRFTAQSGRVYTITTTNLGAKADTIVRLYATNGATLLVENDDGGVVPRASRMFWACSSNRVSLLRVHEKTNGFGHAANYDLQVTGSLFTNKVPTNILLSASTVAENLPGGTWVGGLSALDPDLGSTFTYSLVAGVGASNNASFSISGTNLLTAVSFDYETQTGCSIRVQAVDQGNLVTQKVFLIAISNVVEAPPAVLAVSPAGLDFGPVQVGATNARSFYVQNTGGQPLNGTATVAGVFSVFSGSPYTIAAGASNAVVIRYVTASVGSHSNQVVFTGGGGTSRYVIGQAFSPTNDQDHDGMDDWSEAVAGSNPNSPTSTFNCSFPASNAWPAGAQGVVLQWPSASNRYYSLYRSTNLVIGFNQVAFTNLPATPPLNVYTDAIPSGSGPLLFQLKVETR